MTKILGLFHHYSRAELQRRGVGDASDPQANGLSGIGFIRAPGGGILTRKKLPDNRAKAAMTRPAPRSKVPVIAEHRESDQLARLARTVYENGRLYQGTNSTLLQDARKNGLDPRKKTQSSLDKVVGDEEFVTPDRVEDQKAAAYGHYYFTQLMQSDVAPAAQDYAVLNSGPEHPPAILRAYLTDWRRHTLGMEPDPDSSRPGVDMRTANRIDPGYVLTSQSAKAEPSVASDEFGKEFAAQARRRLHIDVNLSPQDGAELLKEQQTPSPTDAFPPLKGRYAKLDWRSNNAGPEGSRQPEAERKEDA